MANVKSYTVSDFNGNKVELVVNLNVLTPQLCTEINDFWSGNKSRLRAESGDVVRTVVRLFGQYAIQYFMSDGGIAFSNEFNDRFGERSVYCTKEVISYVHEGLPDFDHLGIVISAASVDVPTFDDLTLEENH